MAEALARLSRMPSAAAYVPVSRLSPVRDASDLRRLTLLIESIRPKLVRAGLSTDVADELLARLRSELQRITPTDAT